jgi:hypothetical protein
VCTRMDGEGTDEQEGGRIDGGESTRTLENADNKFEAEVDGKGSEKAHASKHAAKSTDADTRMALYVCSNDLNVLESKIANSKGRINCRIFKMLIENEINS